MSWNRVLCIVFCLIVSLAATGCGDEGGSEKCGNGKLELPEACDPGIAEGEEGACPTECDDGNPETVDALFGDPDTCTAQCIHAVIPSCGEEDGMCPPCCNALLDPDCEPICGNGVVEPGETCDGDCPTACDDGDPCTGDRLTGSAGACTAACAFDAVTDCLAGDGCCPAGCNPLSDGDCEPECGNGVVEPGETCDGDCPTACDDGDPCTDDRLTGSADECTAACAADPVTACLDGDGCCPAGCNALSDEDCAPECGNGVVEPGETCDGDCPSACDDGDPCTDDQLTGSADECTAACAADPVTACLDGDGCCPAGCNALSDEDCAPECGNGVVEPGETCDGDCPSACDDGDPCTDDRLTGSADECTAACPFDPITACVGGDGCCPVGCDPATDPDCSGTGDTGDPCDSGVDCAGGRCLEDTAGWPDGYCTQSCSSIITCDAGSYCTLVMGEYLCLAECAGLICRTGYACIDVDFTGVLVCYPGCTSDLDCPQTAPVCGSDGLCGPCMNSSDCARFPSALECDPTTGECIAGPVT